MERLGAAIAKVISGSWRPVLSRPVSITLEELSPIVPLLLGNGTAALAWRRLNSFAHDGQSLLDLKNAYRQFSIEAALHEMNVCDIFRRARAAGIEPILFKGWALARLYPDDGLRPYGDIDLWMTANDLPRFNTVLSLRNDSGYCVEPHGSFYPSYERSFADVMSRSKLVRLDKVQVRVPCDEDHLRFICLHFLFHGGWRPLWLCDIALMVESAGADFDWDRCLSGKRKHADWIACTIGLAHQLLGADVRGTAVERRAHNVPAWLSTALLRQWGKGSGMSGVEKLSLSLPARLRERKKIISALREHWRNPIQASVEMNASFGSSPRSMWQISSAVSRLPAFAEQLARDVLKAQ